MTKICLHCKTINETLFTAEEKIMKIRYNSLTIQFWKLFYCLQKPLGKEKQSETLEENNRFPRLTAMYFLKFDSHKRYFLYQKDFCKHRNSFRRFVVRNMLQQESNLCYKCWIKLLLLNLL